MDYYAISLIDVIIFLSAIGSLFYWYFTYTFDYWKKQKVAYEKPYPIVGTFAFQLSFKEHPALHIQKTYKKYHDQDVVGGFLSRRPELLVRNPDIIKQMFVKDFSHFHDRGFTTNVEQEPLLQHLFLANGEQWKILRQKLTPTFTSGKMKNAFPILTECGKEFQNYIEEILSDGQDPEMRDLMAKFTTDVIGSYAFGIKMNSMKDENAPFRVMGRKIFAPSISRTLRFGMNRIFPRLSKLLHIRITTMEIQNFFTGLFKSVVESRDNKPSSRHDFIDLLIELKNKGYVESEKKYLNDQVNDTSTTFKTTDELLAAQAFIFFGAGFETSSTALSFTFYELAKNKPIQRQLIEEIDRVLANNDGQITYEAVKDMKYLGMVIKETLRKYPPAAVLNRMCTVPYTIPYTNITLDKGTLVTIPLYALHHDSKYFPEPERFIPERFTKEEEDKRHPFVYMPFGDGPRACIGLRFARLQIMVGLVSVLQKYTVECSEKTAAEITFSKTSLILASDKGIFLKLTKRKITD